MKRFFSKKYLVNKYLIGAVIILLGTSYYFYTRGSASPTLESATASIGNILEKVSVTGKISPVGKADLAFEKGGVIKSINVKVGDKIKKGDLIASLDSAGDSANLASAQAKLEDLTRSLNPQELAVEQSKVNTAQAVLVNAKQEALNAARSGYVQAQSAINNYADVLFDNPQSANPSIKVRTQSQNEQTEINQARLEVTDALIKWKGLVDSASKDFDAEKIVSDTNIQANIVKSFMSRLSTIINNLSPGNSGLSQIAIDGYLASINSGLTLMNQSMTSVTSAKTGFDNASLSYDQTNNNFLLKKSGVSSQTIAAQKAIVAAYKAEYEKDRIVSPIYGVITHIDPNVGEFVSVGKTAFSVISEGIYKIEAYVPEADIAKIVIGNLASTTLDAYGQNVDFPAIVMTVDPAETILEGVPTYKVTLEFINKDDRIRSGMTANLEILTHQHNNVITIPTRAVVDTSGTKTVRLLRSDGINFTPIPVEVGLRGSNGTIEVVSGLNVGDRVVTYIK